MCCEQVASSWSHWIAAVRHHRIPRASCYVAHAPRQAPLRAPRASAHREALAEVAVLRKSGLGPRAKNIDSSETTSRTRPAASCRPRDSAGRRKRGSGTSRRGRPRSGMPPPAGLAPVLPMAMASTTYARSQASWNVPRSRPSLTLKPTAHGRPERLLVEHLQQPAKLGILVQHLGCEEPGLGAELEFAPAHADHLLDAGLDTVHLELARLPHARYFRASAYLSTPPKDQSGLICSMIKLRVR